MYNNLTASLYETAANLYDSNEIEAADCLMEAAQILEEGYGTAIGALAGGGIGHAASKLPRDTFRDLAENERKQIIDKRFMSKRKKEENARHQRNADRLTKAAIATPIAMSSLGAIGGAAIYRNTTKPIRTVKKIIGK